MALVFYARTVERLNRSRIKKGGP